MSIIHPKNIEEKIINILTSGEKTTISLFEGVKKTYPITKQGFYKSLRKLKSEEVILIYNKIVSLDAIWIKNTQKMVEKIANSYSMNPETQEVLNIENGESAAYTFSTIKNLDTFWGHAQSAFIKITPKSEPIFSYDPHYWFFYAREKREKELLREMIEQKRQFLMTVGGSYPLDKKIKESFNNDHLQYNYDKFFPKNNFYMTLVGDYVIEVSLDSEISTKIDQIFQNELKITDSVAVQLQILLEKKSKNKIKISNNSKKAAKLKTKFQKDFYVLK